MEQFDISVSRVAKNKAGYGDISKTDFGNSFHVEEHTLETLRDDVLLQGYAITGAMRRLPPGERALERNPSLCTYRHTENFIGTSVIPLDDDGKLPHSASFWRNDEFFNKHGAFVHHSASSRKDKEKVHPFFILEDHVITTAQEYAEVLKAFAHYYPRIDRLIDCVRVTYGAHKARCLTVGKYITYETLKKEILEPYRELKRQERVTIDLEMINRKNSFVPGEASNDLARSFIIGRLTWFSDFLSNLTANRNTYLYWAGRFVDGGLSTKWVAPHSDLLYEAEKIVLNAFTANGYLSDHAKGNDDEVLRIYRLGRAAGGDTWEEPQAQASWFIFDVGTEVKTSTGATGKIERRLRPRTHAGVTYSAYQIENCDIIFAEHQLAPIGEEVAIVEEIAELDQIDPPLTQVQKIQVVKVIERRTLEAYQAGLKRARFPFDYAVGEFYGVGTRINEDGEMDYVYPIKDASGDVVNIEFIDSIGGRSYAIDKPTQLFNATDHVTDATKTIIVPDIPTAIISGLMSDSEWRVLGLHELEFDGDRSELEGELVYPEFYGSVFTEFMKRKLNWYSNGRELKTVKLPFSPEMMLSAGGSRAFKSFITA